MQENHKIKTLQNVKRVASFELIAQDIQTADINMLHALSLSVGWPHRPADWEILRHIGQGFIAVDGIGRIFGSAMWYPHSEGLATIGMVITTPRAQSQGNGRWLMEQIFEQCDSPYLSLNATTEAYNLYLSLGFSPEATVYQCQGEIVEKLPDIPAFDNSFRRLGQADMEAIIALDNRAFGANREKLLRLLALESDLFGLFDNEQLKAFSYGRQFGRGNLIGPLVAASDEDAIILTAVHMQGKAGEFFRIDTRENGGAFTHFLSENKLFVYNTVTTMSKGKPFLNQNKTSQDPHIYGLAGHALG